MNTVKDLSDLELARFIEAVRDNLNTATTIANRLLEAAYLEASLRTYHGEFLSAEKITVPTEDMAQIVRCVHEEVCPVCGFGAKTIRLETREKDNPNGWNYALVQCRNGHSAEAEPNESGNDYVGWWNGYYVEPDAVP